MKFLPGKVTLANIENGVLNAGVVPLDRFVRTRVAGSNGAASTPAAATLTDLAVLDLGTVEVGDLVLMFGNLRFTGLADQADANQQFNKSAGTSAGNFFNGQATISSNMTASEANQAGFFALVAIWKVTTAGTLTLRMQWSNSTGSATCPVNGGQAEALVLRNS